MELIKMSAMLVYVLIFSLFVSGVTCMSPGATNSYIRAPGKVLPGPIPTNSFKVSQNVSLAQCAAECSLEFHLNKFHCYAFEYVAPTRMCVLTNVTTLVLKGGYLGLLSNSHMDYYERSKGHYSNLFQPYPDQYLADQSSYFTVFHNMTLEKCAYYCLLESRDTCMSFSYSVEKQACGLSKVFYSSTNGQNLVTNTGGYSHYQYFTTWPCNATIPWNYSPRAIASPYFPYALVQDVNCHVTLEAPMGKQVDLTFSTFFTKSDICIVPEAGIAVYDGNSTSGILMSKLCSTDHFVDRKFQSSSGYLYIQYTTGKTPMAFKAVFDFIELDPCDPNPCANSGECVRAEASFTCTCQPGYTGLMCDIDIDECSSNPCYMGGQCVDDVDGFHCNCPRLLGGTLCDEFVGLCYLDPCQNGGTCTPRGTASYVCNCPIGVTGQNCSTILPDPCQSQPCLNNAQCTPDLARGSFTCACVEGFEGKYCENNIDDCASSPCLHNIPCTDLLNDFHCACPEFMGGKTCSDFIGQCHTHPCQKGHCEPTGRDNYTCVCDRGYTGRNCDTLFIDFCDPNPCHHGHCTSFPDGLTCSCDTGYEGFFCDHKTNYCEKVNCTRGECVNIDNDFRCDCTEGFEGRYCNQSVNHCKTANCHGGICINTMTSHFCVCRNGKTSSDCETEAGMCGDVVCKHGDCISTEDNRVCNCQTGYMGNSCDVIDHCVPNPCIHGNCNNKGDEYACSCDINYTGNRCDVIIDPCKENDCIYGFCLARNQSYECVCAAGYHGKYCQYKPDETDPATTTLPTSSTSSTTTKTSACPCKNGLCDEDFPNVCICQPGFSGRLCDVFEGCNKQNPCRHGNCTETGDDYRCVCDVGYYGRNCGMVDVCGASPCKEGVCVPLGSSSFRCVLSPLTGTSNTSQVVFPWLALALAVMTSCEQTEFDIVGTPGHADLVLFDNVISCYRSDRDITVNYVLGDNVAPTTWDWVGVYHTDWRVLGEYVVYRWTQAQAFDCTAPNRRAVVFPARLHQIRSDRFSRYQFLYISHGNHVVGASKPFRVYDEADIDDLHLEMLFARTVISGKRNAKSRKRAIPADVTYPTSSTGEDSFEIIHCLDTPSVARKRARRKDKVTTVFRDSQTLLNIPTFNDWAQRLRFINTTESVVQEYPSIPTSGAVVPYLPTNSLLPVYNIRWKNEGFRIHNTPSSRIQTLEPCMTPNTTTMTPGQLAVQGSIVPSIEYPRLSSIKPGPMSFLSQVTSGCSNCQIGRMIMTDMIQRATQQDQRLYHVKQQLSKHHHHQQQQHASTSTADLLNWALQHIQEDNSKLRARVLDLEERLADVIARQDTSTQTVTQEDLGHWLVRDPKRIARMKSVIGRQCRDVQLLRQCYDNRQRQVQQLTAENTRLRNLVKGAFETSSRFQELSEELSDKMKLVLADRDKEHMTGWMTNQVKEKTTTTTQTTDEDTPIPCSSEAADVTTKSCKTSLKTLAGKHLKNKQISKILKSENQRAQRLHKEQSEAEKCPTCGLKFSKKADRRVIEEHLVFHQRANKSKHVSNQ